MSTSLEPSPSELHRSIAWILIAVGVGMMAGRILAVDSIDLRGLEKTRLAKTRGDLADARRALAPVLG